jgi:hypothetical protein
MSINLLLPFASAAIMLAFTSMVLSRWFRNRKPHFLLWGLGLAMFGIASLTEVLLTTGWNRAVFFSWYLFGAILTAAWIGHGTLLLLFRKRWTRVVTGVLIVGSLAAAMLLLQVMPRLDESIFVSSVPISEQYRDIMPAIDDGGGVRLLTIPFNIYGTLTLVGGAIWSSWLFWRKRVMPNRALGNVLIAIGALVIASASSLTRLGEGSFLYLGELLAGALMFSGFLVSGKPQPEEEAAPAQVQAAV